MGKIEIKNVVLGGLADSDFLGAEGSVASIVGFDLHSEPGILKVNQKLTKESGTTIDAFVKVMVPCSNGETYLFSSTTGKIWRRKSDGTYQLAYTTVPGAGDAGCTGAVEYQGYIYWATQNRLHRITTANALTTSWSSLDLNWGTFTNGNANFHPMREVNGILFIGDSNLLASVKSGVFNTTGSSTLDIKTPLQIKCLGKRKTDILLGTYTADNIVRSQVIRWDTWSVSYDETDEIPEVGINAFLDIDNEVIVSAGTKGNLYRYDGSNLNSYKTIKGDYSGTNKAYVHPNASFNFNGLPLFGLSNVSGNPSLLGVYSLARHNMNYPYVLALEFVISQNKTSSVEIGAITGAGDIFLVSWKDGSTYGVDKLDADNKYSGAYFEARVVTIDRDEPVQFGKVSVGYRTLPANTDITINRKINYGSYNEDPDVNIPSVKDTDQNIKVLKHNIGGANTLQVKISTTASGNNAPEIDNTIINLLNTE